MSDDRARTIPDLAPPTEPTPPPTEPAPSAPATVPEKDAQIAQLFDDLDRTFKRPPVEYEEKRETNGDEGVRYYAQHQLPKATANDTDPDTKIILEESAPPRQERTDPLPQEPHEAPPVHFTQPMRSAPTIPRLRGLADVTMPIPPEERSSFRKIGKGTIVAIAAGMFAAVLALFFIVRVVGFGAPETAAPKSPSVQPAAPTNAAPPVPAPSPTMVIPAAQTGPVTTAVGPVPPPAATAPAPIGTLRATTPGTAAAPAVAAPSSAPAPRGSASAKGATPQRPKPTDDDNIKETL